MLRVWTRTTPLKPAWTAGRGVIPLGRDCGPSLLGPVRLRRTPPRFPGLRNSSASAGRSSWLSARRTDWRRSTCRAIGWTPTAADRGGVRRFALPTGRGYAPHRNRAAGASLKASPRLAPGRWTRPPLRGRWQAFFRRLPPSAIADPSTPRARGAKGPRHGRCGAWSLAPTREAGGPRPHARPIAALARANRPPAWGGCAPTRLPFGKGWAPGRSAPPKVQRAPKARAALGGPPMLRVRSVQVRRRKPLALTI